MLNYLDRGILRNLFFYCILDFNLILIGEIKNLKNNKKVFFRILSKVSISPDLHALDCKNGSQMVNGYWSSWKMTSF